MAARERAEQLVVEIVAVGQHHDGRVLHRRVQDHPPGVERHCQALAGTLRVPDHADPAVALFAAGHRPRVVAALLARLKALGLVPALHRNRRAQGFFQRDIDGVKLVVAGDLLGQLAGALVLEHDEMAHQIEKAALLEHAFEHHLQFGKLRRVIVAGNGAPRLEPFLAGAQRADARLHAVGDDQRRIGREQRRNLRL